MIILSDCVSDLDFPTPTAAAEFIVPNIIDIQNSIENYRLQLKKLINNHFRYLEKDLDKIKNNYLMKKPKVLFEDKIERLTILKEKSENNLINQIAIFETSLKNLKCSFILRNPDNLYKTKVEKVHMLNSRLERSIEKYLGNAEVCLNNLKISHVLKNPEGIYTIK